MKELIDRNALLAEYDRQHEGEPGKARKLIEDAPEAVVLCKDCAFCHYNSSNGTHKCVSMNGMFRTVKPDEFCSYGERGTNETL